MKITPTKETLLVELGTRNGNNKQKEDVSDIDKINYKYAQAIVRRKITEQKNKCWERNCNKINTYLGGRKSTESWKLLSLGQNKKRDLISPITLGKWESHFGKLLTEDRPEFQNNENNRRIIEVTASPIRINVKKVKDICTQLKNGKAAGPGDIPPELIKYAPKELYYNIRKKCLKAA